MVLSDEVFFGHILTDFRLPDFGRNQKMMSKLWILFLSCTENGSMSCHDKISADAGPEIA